MAELEEKLQKRMLRCEGKLASPRSRILKTDVVLPSIPSQDWVKLKSCESPLSSQIKSLRACSKMSPHPVPRQRRDQTDDLQISEVANGFVLVDADEESNEHERITDCFSASEDMSHVEAECAQTFTSFSPDLVLPVDRVVEGVSDHVIGKDPRDLRLQPEAAMSETLTQAPVNKCPVVWRYLFYYFLVCSCVLLVLGASFRSYLASRVSVQTVTRIGQVFDENRITIPSKVESDAFHSDASIANTLYHDVDFVVLLPSSNISETIDRTRCDELHGKSDDVVAKMEDHTHCESIEQGDTIEIRASAIPTEEHAQETFKETTPDLVRNISDDNQLKSASDVHIANRRRDSPVGGSNLRSDLQLAAEIQNHVRFHHDGANHAENLSRTIELSSIEAAFAFENFETSTNVSIAGSKLHLSARVVGAPRIQARHEALSIEASLSDDVSEDFEDILATYPTVSQAYRIGRIYVEANSSLSGAVQASVDLAILNDGAVPWPANAKLQLLYGDDLGLDSLRFDVVVMPGFSLDLSMQLYLPGDCSIEQSSRSMSMWMLEVVGHRFGPLLLLEIECV